MVRVGVSEQRRPGAKICPPAHASDRVLMLSHGAHYASQAQSATVNFRLCPAAEARMPYARLAPTPYQLGSSVRGRAATSYAGNSQLRCVLYFVSLCATRYNLMPRLFSECLRAHLNDQKLPAVLLPASPCISPEPWCQRTVFLCSVSSQRKYGCAAAMRRSNLRS